MLLWERVLPAMAPQATVQNNLRGVELASSQQSLFLEEESIPLKLANPTRTLIASLLIVSWSSVHAASMAPVAAANGMVVTAQHLEIGRAHV